MNDFMDGILIGELQRRLSVCVQTLNDIAILSCQSERRVAAQDSGCDSCCDITISQHQPVNANGPHVGAVSTLGRSSVYLSQTN